MGRIAIAGAAGAWLMLLLAGCATGPDMRAIAQQAAQIRATCEAQFQHGTLKTHLATEQCAEGPIRNLYASAGFPDMDVINAYLAQRNAIASQQDRGVLSAEEAQADFAQALVQQNSELQRRAANRAAFLYSSMPVFCNHVGPGLVMCQ